MLFFDGAMADSFRGYIATARPEGQPIALGDNQSLEKRVQVEVIELYENGTQPQMYAEAVFDMCFCDGRCYDLQRTFIQHLKPDQFAA